MLTHKNSLQIIFLVSALTIAGAWFFELVLGLDPCPLCLTQRLPYYAALILSLVYLTLRKFEKWFLILLLIIFSISLYYGVYHAGAEWGFWQGPTSCGGGKVINQSADNLLNSLNETKIIDCTKAAWRFLGVSLAGFNALISTFLIALSASTLFKK